MEPLEPLLLYRAVSLRMITRIELHHGTGTGHGGPGSPQVLMPVHSPCVGRSRAVLAWLPAAAATAEAVAEVHRE